jgi:uncharacterized membrane protein
MNADLFNPSDWRHRTIAIVLATIGCAIAMYLALYQWHATDRIFDPFFGDGSRRVLRQSAIARFLPVPDAFLGAIVYFAEAIAAAAGDEHRFRTAPRIVIAYGCISAALALAAIFLLLAQALVVHAWCTLCLCSAVLSLALAALAAPEVVAALRHTHTKEI